MNDGSHIVFINEEPSRKRSEEKELLHDHKCTEPEDIRSKATVRTKRGRRMSDKACRKNNAGQLY